MPGVWNPLAEPDQGAVVLRESGRLDKLPDRDVPQARQDLGAEYAWVRRRSLPRPDRPLVCGVLGTALFGGATPMPGIPLFGAEHCQDVRCILATAIGVASPALVPAPTAIAMPRRRQLRPAIPTTVRKQKGACTLLALAAVRLPPLPGHLQVALSQGRQQRQGGVRVPSKPMSDPLHYWRDLVAPRAAGLRESPSDPRMQSTGSLPSFDEVASRKRPLCEQCEQVCIYCRPHGLHCIEGHRSAIALVSVEDPEPRVQADGVTREDRLRFKEGVEVVEDRSRRVGREARAAADHRCALSKGAPMFWKF